MSSGEPRSGSGVAVATTAAAVALAGGAVAAFPQHALSIVQVLVLTTAVAVGLQVLSTTVVWRRVHGLYDRWTYLMSPFRQTGAPEKRRYDVPELDRVVALLGRSRSRDSRLPAVPPEVALRLGRIARAELFRQGVDPHDPAHQAAYRQALSPVTWQVILYRPEDQQQRHRYAPPDSAGTAALVHTVLDDLDRFRNGARASDRPADQNRPTRGIR